MGKLANDIEKSDIIFRVLASFDPVTWNVLSFWSKAEDCELANGKTVEQVLTEISGITSATKITMAGTSVVNDDAIHENITSSAYLTNYLAGEVVSIDTLSSANNRSLVMVQIPTLAWVPGTYTNYGPISYKYKYEVDVTAILVPHPIMYLYGVGIGDIDAPSLSQRNEWVGIDMFATQSSKKLVFLSEYKPISQLNIGLKGVIL